MLVPKLFTTLKTYTREQLVADLTAGVIVGIVALERSGLLEEIGEANLFGDIDEALAAAKAYVGIPPDPSTSRLSA